MRQSRSAYCRRQIGTRAAAGVILLEAVLALTLFVATAATVGAVMNHCSDAAYRLRIRTRAADMAVTLLSEIQMGLIEPDTIDPTEYEDEALLDWTWQVEVETLEDPNPLLAVTVTVTHEPTGVFHRLTRWVTAP